MLQNIRDLVTGWLAVAIVVLLIIPFAFWGINYYFDQGPRAVIATVDDSEISLNQFQRAYSLYRMQLQELNADLDINNDEFLKQQVLNQLVNSEILNKAVKDANLQISDETVAGTIKNIKAFQNEQGFNQAAYEYGVNRLGMTTPMYENQMRLDLASEQLQSAVIESVVVTDAEVEHIARLNNQTRDITYAVLSADDIKDSIAVTDEDLQRHYQNNKNRYMTEEQVKLAYIYLSREKLARDIEVPEESLEEFYQQNKSKYDVQEERKFSQLVFAFDDDASEEEINKAKSNAEKAKTLLNEGSTFNEIAEQYTDEFGDKFQLIERGFMEKRLLTEEVSSVLFDMQTNDISDVIDTKNSFQILQLVEIRGGRENSLDNVREEVVKDYQWEQSQDLYFELADRLATLTYENPDTLQSAAESLGLDIQESEYFGRQGLTSDPLRHPSVTRASFSEEVLLNGQNSEALELSDDQIIVLRVLDHKPASVKPLEEVRTQVEEDIKILQASNTLRTRGNQILADLKDGKSPEEVSTTYNFEWSSKSGVTINDVSIKRAITRAAFTMAAPKSGQPSVKGTVLGTGDYAIVLVNQIGEPEEIDAKQLDEIKTELKNNRAATEWAEFMESLRSETKIEVFQDRL